MNPDTLKLWLSVVADIGKTPYTRMMARHTLKYLLELEELRKRDGEDRLRA